MKNVRAHFQYDNQSYLHLSCILSTTLGLPGIILGKQLANQFGVGTAICSIIIGNLIAWIISICMISMMDRTHSNAIINIKNYVGTWGGLISAVIFMFSLLNWYAFQLNSSMIEFNSIYQFDVYWRKDLIIRFGAAFGILSALLSIGGIRWVKRLTIFCLPLFICYHLYGIISSGNSISLKGTWNISFSAIFICIFNLLPGVINFPTFFRHSRSRAHSFLALTIITILIIFFQISAIWMNFSFSTGTNSFLDLTFIMIFIILMLMCVNSLNIYLASACWEAISPHLITGKEYAIIGLFGTLFYTLVQITTPVQLMQDLSNGYIACLGVVLLLAFLIRSIVRHRPRPLEKRINFLTWIVGCVVVTVYETQHFLQGFSALLAGMNACILFFIFVIFIEETIWALRKKIDVQNTR